MSVTDLSALPLIMDADDVAPVLGVTRRTVFRMIAAGQLDHVTVTVGARKRVSRHLLEQWLRGELADP